jgi:hypothetical protein
VYILAAAAVLLLAWRIWAGALPFEVRFSGLLLATALVNPHMYVYDLTILTPLWYLLPSVWNGWSVFDRRVMGILLVGLYLVPVVAPPIAATLRFQPATPIMCSMLLLLWRQRPGPAADVAPRSIAGVVGA